MRWDISTLISEGKREKTQGMQQRSLTTFLRHADAQPVSQQRLLCKDHSPGLYR